MPAAVATVPSGAAVAVAEAVLYLVIRIEVPVLLCVVASRGLLGTAGSCGQGCCGRRCCSARRWVGKGSENLHCTFTALQCKPLADRQANALVDPHA